MPILALRGDHALDTMDQAFRDTIHDLATAHRLIVVDLSQTTFLDSTVLGVLIGASRKARSNGGRLRVHIGANNGAGKLFTRLNLDQHFEVAQSLSDATRLAD